MENVVKTNVILNKMHKELTEWTRATGIHIPDSPEAQTGRQGLRCKLMREEVAEYDEAAFFGDIYEVFDALIDQLYILWGTIVEHGFTEEQVQKGFREVHRSNMSKLCRTRLEAEETIEAYYNGTHPDKPGEKLEDKYSLGTVQVAHGQWAVTRNDGKIMKSINYSPPQLPQILQS